MKKHTNTIKQKGRLKKKFIAFKKTNCPTKHINLKKKKVSLKFKTAKLKIVQSFLLKLLKIIEKKEKNLKNEIPTNEDFMEAVSSIPQKFLNIKIISPILITISLFFLGNYFLLAENVPQATTTNIDITKDTEIQKKLKIKSDRLNGLLEKEKNKSKLFDLFTYEYWSSYEKKERAQESLDLIKEIIALKKQLSTETKQNSNEKNI